MKKYLTIVIAALLASTAYAAGGPPAGRGGGKPGGGEETAGNNLSVPAIFISGSGTTAPSIRIACTEAPKNPGWDGAVATYLFEGEYYWLQKSDATWSASCGTATSSTPISVSADWGDNLTGDGRLASGRPIRVEVGLVAQGVESGTGYPITKLTPELEDRLATYGTNGDQVLTSYRVFDPSAMLRIDACASVDCLTVNPVPVYEGPMTAEINSGGAVVYGYNWGIQGQTNAPETGTYRITFGVTYATIVGVADSKASYDTTTNTTYVYIKVGSKGGGGSRRK